MIREYKRNASEDARRRARERERERYLRDAAHRGACLARLYRLADEDPLALLMYDQLRAMVKRDGLWKPDVVPSRT